MFLQVVLPAIWLKIGSFGALLSTRRENNANPSRQASFASGARALWRLAQSAFDGLVRCVMAESDRWFLWSPVLVGIGIALYFSLSFEPSLWLVWSLLAATLGGLFLLRRQPGGGLAIVATALFCLALGLAVAAARTAMVAAPVLASSWSGEMTGRVLESETTDKGALSVAIAPLAMQRLAADVMPARVRLSIRIKGVDIEPGQTVRLRARLLPPPEPVEPGGFDYARKVWFERIGATGFAYSAPQVISAEGEGMAVWLARLRARITARVQAEIAGPAGAVAAALITGEKRAIPEDAVNDLRRAGLSHVLSISGLHMVLFAGSLFWLLRAALALVPSLALNYPIKKWAAAVALIGASIYLMISGAGIATQRAWVMISLMFVAILLDRPAISMRNVALAALFVLVWQPESFLSASFHMSFAAVVALIAFYEAPVMQRFLASDRNTPVFPALAPVILVARYIAGIALTTTVAGVATGAFAAFHFDRIAPYSMAGNLGAMPLVSLIIMPAALISLLLMPFGLDHIPLWIMGQGIDAMLGIAHYVASWEGSDHLVAAAPTSALVAVTLGGLWLALWRRRWRYFGLVPIVAGLLLWGQGPRPDILINRDGRLVALRGPDGQLVLSAARPAYAAETWLRHDGDARAPKEAARSAAKRCDALGCVWREPGEPVIAIPATLDALRDDCANADIIVARFGLPYRLRKQCKASVIVDYFDLWREGATTLTREPDGTWKRRTVRRESGNRPWVQFIRKEKSSKRAARAVSDRDK